MPGAFVEAPQVSIKKLELEAEERKAQRDEERRRAAATQPVGLTGEALATVQRMVEERAANLEQIYRHTISSMRAESDRLLAQVEQKDQRLSEVNEQLVHERTTLAGKMKEEETRQLKEQRERFDDERQRLKDDSANRITLLRDELQRQLNEDSRRAADERERLVRSEQNERERIRADSERREVLTAEQHKVQIQSLRDSYESRLNEMQRNHDSRLQDLRMSMDQQMGNLKDTTEREIRSIHTTEGVKVDMAERTAQAEIAMQRAEMGRLQAIIDSQQREMDDLRNRLDEECRKSAPKGALEEIQHARNLIAEVGGQDNRWQDAVVNILKDGVKASGKFVETWSQQRGMMQAGMAPGGHPQVMSPQMRGAPGHHQLPPGAAGMSQAGVPQQMTQQRRTPRPPQAPFGRPQQRMGAGQSGPSAPPPITGRGIAARTREPDLLSLDDGAADAEPVKASEPQQQPPPQQQQQPPPVQYPCSSAAEGMSAGPSPPPPSPSPEPEPLPDMPPAPPSPEPPSSEPKEIAGPSLEITEEELTELQGQLEAAINTGMVTAEEFADQLLKQVDPSALAHVLSSLSADQLVDLIEKGGGHDSVIVGREGRTFINELWGHVATKLQALAGTQQAG
jgi:hypothetical protein